MPTAPARRLRNAPVRPSVERLEGRRLLASYSVTDLGITPRDLNDAGQVVGVAGGHAVVWQAGVVTDLGTLGGATSDAAGVNNAGAVVGTSAVDATASGAAFLWRGGVMTDLGLGNPAGAVAVNDAGDVAANAGGRAVLWRDGAATDLGSLGAGGAEAADVNNAGQVVGASWAGGYDGALGLPSVHAFLWQGGAMTDLGTPAFTMSSYPRAVNNAGQVVGSSTYYVNTGYGAAVVSRSFFYDGRNMTVLPVPGLQNWAADINDAGQIVGYAGGRAFLYQDGTYRDLNTLVPAGQPILTAAVAVNNAGQIVASNIAGRSVLLTPSDPALIVDDGGPGFAAAGPAPAVLAGQGYGGDARRLFSPPDRLLAARPAATRFASQATWSFSDVAPGTYRISTCWSPGPDRAAAAPFDVISNGSVVASAAVDQRQAPADFTSYGATWHDLAKVTLTGGRLTVRLTNRASGRVIADAVRVERVEGPAVAPAAAAEVTVPPPSLLAAANRRSEAAFLSESHPALW